MELLLREMLDKIEESCYEAELKARDNLLKFTFPPQDHLSKFSSSKASIEFSRFVVGLQFVGMGIPYSDIFLDQSEVILVRAGYASYSEAYQDALCGTQGGLHHVLKTVMDYVVDQLIVSAAGDIITEYWGIDLNEGELSGELIDRLGYLEQYVEYYTDFLHEKFRSRKYLIETVLKPPIFYEHYFLVSKMKNL